MDTFNKMPTVTPNTTLPLPSYPALFYPNKKQDQPFQKIMPSGLLGYYFLDNDFTNLVVIQVGQELHSSWQPNPSYTSVVARELQNFGSIRWIGRIFVPKTGIYQFSSSSGTDVKMSIVVTNSYGPNRNLFYKEYVAIDDGSTLYSIPLQQGNFYEIMIEYRPTTLHHPMQLYWSYNQTTPEVIPSNHLFFPMTNLDARKQKQLMPTQSLFKLLTNDVRLRESRQFIFRDTRGIFDKEQDTDQDGIPDTWEREGYSVILGPTTALQLVKWDDNYAEKGYKKYISNPLSASTAHDAYTDLEKVAVLSMHPMMAAYPIIGVSLEKVIVASTATTTTHEDHSTHTDHSYTNTENIKVDTGFNNQGFSLGVSADYSHSDTSSSGKSDTTGSSLQISESAAATINFNIRYYNTGNIELHNVKPTMNFVIKKETFATVKPQRDLGQEATILREDHYYPPKEKPAMALVSSDQFNSGYVHLNLNQFKAFLKGEEIEVSTSQVEGDLPQTALSLDPDNNYIIDPSLGSSTKPFSDYQSNIERHTASIILIIGGSNSLPRERRIVAKDPKDILDTTPVLTLKDALLLIENTRLENYKLIYTVIEAGIETDLSLEESAVQIITDDFTRNRIKKQSNIQSVYDVVIEPGMNFTIRFPDIYDDANQGVSNNEVFHWRNVREFIQDSVESQGYCYACDHAAFGALTSKMPILDENSNYLLSAYVKSSNKPFTKADAQVMGTSSIDDFYKIYNEQPVEIGDVIKIYYREAGRLWFAYKEGQEYKYKGLYELLSVDSTSEAIIPLTVTAEGFQYQQQVFPYIAIGGLNANNPAEGAVYGYIYFDAETKRFSIQQKRWSPIHEYFPETLYFAMTLYASKTFYLGLGTEADINNYILSTPFQINANKWNRLNFVFNVNHEPQKMNTVLILSNEQQEFQFDAISLTKISKKEDVLHPSVQTVAKQHTLLSISAEEWHNKRIINHLIFDVPETAENMLYEVILPTGTSLGVKAGYEINDGKRKLNLTEWNAGYGIQLEPGYNCSRLADIYLVDPQNPSNKEKIQLPRQITVTSGNLNGTIVTFC